MQSRRMLVAAIAAIWVLAGCGGRFDVDADTPASAMKAAGAAQTTNAVYTTTNPDEDGTGHCQNGNEAVNCNIYDGKKYVWLSGGPLTGNAGLPDGPYFFAVLVPGQQNNPNDGSPDNLSDLFPTTNTGAGDGWKDRVFTLKQGILGYEGPHDFSGNKIRLVPFDDTTNPGGEYILAVCALTERDGEFNYPVDPSDCKYDAFKVALADLKVNVEDPLSYDETFHWTIAKSVDRTLVKQAETEATFSYVVEVSRDDGETSNWALTGTVEIENPNGVDISADVAITIEDDGPWTCTPASTTVTIPADGTTTIEVACSYDGADTPSGGLLTATVTWDAGGEPRTVTICDPLDDETAIVNQTDECVSVEDRDELGFFFSVTFCAEDGEVLVVSYERTVTSPPGTCTDNDNVATFVTNDTGATGDASQTVELCVGADLKVTKTATPSFVRAYVWEIDKGVDPHLVEQFGGTATFHYAVDVAQTAVTDSDWVVTGTIEVTNPNDWQDIDAEVFDIADGGTCTLYVEYPVTLKANETRTFDYACTFASGTAGLNFGVVTWNATVAFTPSMQAWAIAPFEFTWPTTRLGQFVTIDDTVAGTLGTLVGTDEPPFAMASYLYDRDIAVPTWDCVTYDNTATITETGQSDSELVEVCGPHKSAARTIGFWQNRNGQAILTGGVSTSGTCNAATWLRQFMPFADLSATATCTQLATYVTNVIKVANASGASMNAMLKAQMLATALDVYFSDGDLGGNKLLAPGPIGDVVVDLTTICADLTCTSFEDSSPAFDDEPLLAVFDVLVAAAAQSNTGGTLWYGNVKATQELAKDAFDAINNEKVFAP